VSDEANMNETSGDLGAALRSSMDGREAPSVAAEPLVKDTPPSNVSNLDTLIAQDEAPSQEPAQDAPEEVEANSTEEIAEQLELKVKGYKEPFKINKDWEDPKVQEYLNKGARFDKAMQEVARQRKELESKIQNMQDYEDNKQRVGQVESAQKLMAEGYHEEALEVILGSNTEALLETLLNKKIAYQNASPEERLKMDLERRERQENLRKQSDADRIAKLEAQINARSEQVREAEYSGYLEDAIGRYDASQWVEDTGTAEYLNDVIKNAAMSDIVKLQRQREANGKDNITQRDIRRAFANHASKLIKSYESQASKVADQKVAEQQEVAKQNAQVASTKNYGTSDPVSEWKKSGGRMSDLVDMLSRGGIR